MKKQFYLILVVLFVVLIAGSGSWGLTESSEARYAEIAREMFVSRDYLHPTLLGIRHYHKPPVTYVITAIGYELFGINEFGARFFLSVALVLQVFFVYKIGLLLFKSDKKAMASALIYISFPVVLIAARNLTTDAFLTTFILWALYYWLLRKEGRSVLFLYLFYLLLGVAFLTKGPVILLPPLMFILFWKIIKKEKFRINVHTFFGSLLFLLISASWFVAVIVDQPQLLDYFVKDQIIKRSMEAQKFHRSKPFWYYLVFAPLLGLPWFIFVATECWKNIKYVRKKWRNEAILFWSILMLLFIFSLFSSKLVLYILPVFPFVALLGGALVEVVPPKRLKVYSIIYAVLFVLLLAGLFFLSLSARFEFSFWYTLIFCAAISFLLYFFLKMTKNRVLRPVHMGLAFALLLIPTYAFFASQNDQSINSIKDLSSFIKQQKQEIKQVVVFDHLLSSAAFYFDEPVVTVNDGNFNTHRETKFEIDSSYKRTYINLQQKGEIKRFQDLLQQKDNVLLLRKKKEFPDSLQYLLKVFQHRAEKGKWIVYY